MGRLAVHQPADARAIGRRGAAGAAHQSSVCQSRRFGCGVTRRCRWNAWQGKHSWGGNRCGTGVVGAGTLSELGLSWSSYMCTRHTQVLE